jgi:hypothetical protein
MNTHHARDLALKLFGISYLFRCIIYFPQLIGMFNMMKNHEQFGTSPLSLAMTVIAPLTFWLTIGVVLMFRTTAVLRILWPRQQNDKTESATVVPAMSFWIVLICFYFLVGAVGGASSELYTLFVKPELRHLTKQIKFFPHIITIMFSAICIFKAEVIGKWLTQHISKDSQQNPGT